jgi:tetratricopeptide (TPR) repeat protein
VTAPLRRAAAALAGLLAAGALAGCASGRVSQTASERLRRALDQLGLPAQVGAPLEPDEEIRRWAAERSDLVGSPEERLERLLQALLDRDGTRFVYTSGETTTVVETWRTGRANCLAFSQLFVVLAREIGLEAYFLRVRDVASFEREGDLVVSSDHVTAAWGPAPARRVLDFTARPVRDYHQVEPLGDLSALALYYSNVGAERIRAGEVRAAIEALETATRIDPGLADGWVNLGVARRRLADLDGAEAAYRRALEADPEVAAAYHNLAALLELRGRSEEARGLRRLADRRSNRNPWSYLALGDWALGEGRVADAERFYRRARDLAPDNPEPLAALGRAALEAGRERDARRLLRKAAALDPSNPRVHALRARLERGSG